MGWSKEHDDALREWVNEGLPCSQISTEFYRRFRVDYSRSAIIGRKNQLGLCKPKKVKSSSPVQRATKAGANQARSHFAKTQWAGFTAPVKGKDFVEFPQGADVDTVIRDVVAGVDDFRHLDLLDLKPNDCRWPSGAGPFSFCGCPIFSGSYCAAHHRMATRPWAAREAA